MMVLTQAGSECLMFVIQIIQMHWDYDFDINYDGNILMAGSKGGGFYLVLKSSL